MGRHVSRSAETNEQRQRRACLSRTRARRYATVVLRGESSGRREPSRRGAERGGESPVQARVSGFASAVACRVCSLTLSSLVWRGGTGWWVASGRAARGVSCAVSGAPCVTRPYFRSAASFSVILAYVSA